MSTDDIANMSDLQGQLIMLRMERDELRAKLDATTSEFAQSVQLHRDNYNTLRLALLGLVGELRPLITVALLERGEDAGAILARLEAVLSKEA